ncbi:hypothetical protein X777_06893 [Ooceraea biroi]|uniref:Uncharacterized protein n=1 Tax=Ooceraea biroi TaxID=2015173 RepID=A0A026WF52_OOCBI|nr:hypothetical protein X777_06893 [Ooceraea biroi]
MRVQGSRRGGKHSGKGLQDSALQEWWDRRDVRRGLACQDSVAPHPRATINPFGGLATLRPIPRSILTSSAPAGTAAPGRTQRLQGILGDGRDAVN